MSVKTFLVGIFCVGVCGIAVGQITEFAVPCLPPCNSSVGRLGDVTTGSDGNLWFTTSGARFRLFTSAAAICRITRDGVIEQFPLSSTWASDVNRIGDIAAGPDGNLWFTETDNNRIGRITPEAAVLEFPISTSGSGPQGIAAGPDGNLWFTERYANQIGRINPSGATTEFPLPTANSQPQRIAAGPDGNLWFTEGNAAQIGRITTTGATTEFPIPNGAYDIVAGPDGNLWFTDPGGDGIGRTTTLGAVTEFKISTGSGTYPQGIALGPDGNLWFTEGYANQIGRITTSGVIAEFSIPTAGSQPQGITAGADGNIWFTEPGAGKIGTLPTTACPSGAHTLCLKNGRFSVTADFQQTPEGPSTPATAVPLTNDTGYFWFFDPANVEIVAKVLNGCSINGHFWFFGSGLTNLGVLIKVTDTQSMAANPVAKSYSNTVGTPFQPVQDTAALPCP